MDIFLHPTTIPPQHSSFVRHCLLTPFLREVYWPPTLSLSLTPIHLINICYLLFSSPLLQKEFSSGWEINYNFLGVLCVLNSSQLFIWLMDAQQLPLYLQKHIWLMSRWGDIPEVCLFIILPPSTTTMYLPPSPPPIYTALCKGSVIKEMVKEMGLRINNNKK